MAVIIERGKKPIYVNGEYGVAAPAKGIAVGGEVSGKIVMGNGINIVSTVESTSHLAQTVEDLDNEIYIAKKKNEVKTWLGVKGNRERVESIKEDAPNSYQDFIERLGLVEPENNNAGTGAVATAGVVKAGAGGQAYLGNVYHDIVIGTDNRK